MLGPRTQFRPGQWEAIDLIANRRQRLLVVQRTGWGKSAVYFIATKMLRDAGSGPTLLISPLLSLMRNQVVAAERLGLRAAAIHTENREEWLEVERSLRENRCDLLMVAPERLGNAQFMQTILPMFQGSIGLFAIDEAHCISDWGHDFRPDYRRIVRILRLLPPGVPVLCTTATANDRVVADVMAQVPRLQISRGPLVRPSLRLYNIRLADQSERLAWLAHFIPQIEGSGIVYCLTVQDTERVAEWLNRHGVAADAYHAGLQGAQRVAIENRLLENKVKALVATVALGMGFDKPDLGFVIHFQRPGSVVAYYQQVGRAGRAMEKAFGILLNGEEDDEIADYFIDTAFPPAEMIRAVATELERGGALTFDHLASRLNLSRAMLEKSLKLLEIDGAVQHERDVYIRTPNPWSPDVLRAEEVTQKRRMELEQIRRYVEHEGCLMGFLARALDDPNPTRCGRCMNCAQSTRRKPPEELVQKASEFLRGSALVLEPKLRWPTCLTPELDALHLADIGARGQPSSVIPPELRPEPGRILCLYGDGGWGREVANCKYKLGHFTPDLVDAVARLIRERWRPEPFPTWLAAIPSLGKPMVRDFAANVANALSIPFVDVLRKTRATPPQKQMQNRVQQVRNLLGAIEVAGKIPAGPVLLVDDIVDSGWTITLASVLLRAKGSGPVFPLALAKATPRLT